MKRLFLILGLSLGLQAGPDKISCDERIKHGHRGFYKGLVALGAAGVCGYFVWDVLDKLPNLRLSDDVIHKENLRRWPLLKESFFKSISIASLGYVAFKFGKSSKKSLMVFYTDTNNPEAEPRGHVA